MAIERTGEGVCGIVRDKGRGLERDQLQRIFEPFVQVDRARDANGETGDTTREHPLDLGDTLDGVALFCVQAVTLLAARA